MKQDREERFWSRVARTPDGCWEWVGQVDTGGYGIFVFERQVTRASRAAWSLANGEIPNGEGYHGTCVCHTCDNRRCVRPSHLFLSSNKGNIHDAIAKGRFAKGERNGRSRLTEELVRSIRGAYANGGSLRKLGKQFGIGKETVRMVVGAQTWKHVN